MRRHAAVIWTFAVLALFGGLWAWNQLQPMAEQRTRDAMTMHSASAIAPGIAPGAATGTGMIDSSAAATKPLSVIHH